MKYSIIIPSYSQNWRHTEVLERCIISLHNNSGNAEDYEIILVNDGSPDMGIEPISYHTDSYIRNRQNHGIASSWNDGLKISRGEFVAIINDDIIVQDGWLDKLRQALEMEEEYMVSAPGVFGKDNMEQKSGGIVESYQWFPGYCFMLKRDTIWTHGYFDEQFSPFNYEDTDYWTRVLHHGGKLVRNYNTTITHKEGHVLHTLDYDKVSERNKEKFIRKWGFDPIPVFYENQPCDFTKLKRLDI